MREIPQKTIEEAKELLAAGQGLCPPCHPRLDEAEARQVA